MRYFARIRTVKGATERWKALAKRHHPDRGGDSEVMAEINAQYEAKLREIGHKATQSDPGNQATQDMPKGKKTRQTARKGGVFSGDSDTEVEVEEISGEWQFDDADDGNSPAPRRHADLETALRDQIKQTIRIGSQLMVEKLMDMAEDTVRRRRNTNG